MAELFAMKTPSGQLDPQKVQYPILVQPKLDGLRGICIKSAERYGRGAGPTWYSFSGKPLWNLEAVSASLPDDETGVYDGEIIWPGHPFTDANGLCKRQTSDPKTQAQARELQFHIFDRLELEEWTAKQTFRPFQERHARMMYVLRHHTPNVRAVGVDAVDSPEELERYYKLYLGAGYEGLMAKRPKGLYHWTRHPDWHRYKPTITVDVRVIAVYEETSIKGVPKGTLGGCLVEVPADDDFPESTCKVGGGFKAAERVKYWTPERATKAMTRDGATMHDGSPLIGKIIEVEAKCRQPKTGALREPTFVRERPDK